MDNTARFGNWQVGNGSQDTETHTCQVCHGKKYVLVATRKVSHMSTVYERQVCPGCTGAQKSSAAAQTNAPSYDRRKMPSGTGYLRNKKRRRKDDD
ncbi:MAG: hypothetical protein U9N50_14415 [Pseudomonadota bacterium]|nr:hypothetical protein [Pseudomonadota bacterium]